MEGQRSQQNLLLMQKFIWKVFGPIVAAITILSPAVSLAQTPPPPEDGPGRLEERRTQFEEQREQIRQRLDEVRRQRVERFWQNMERKFTRAIERLGNIADRIESRIDKFEEKGADVAEARAKLNEARAQLEEAKAALAAATAAVQDLLISDDPKGAFAEVRTHAQTVKKELREAHSFMVESIRILKGASTAGSSDSETNEN